jgi:hypothetical protein
MGATVRLEDLLPEQDEHFQSEVYANNTKTPGGGYQRAYVVPNVKNIDDKAWLNNLPQPVNNDSIRNENEETRMNQNS